MSGQRRILVGHGGIDGRGEPLSLGLAEVCRHTLVLGKSGSGKSFWLLSVLFQLLAERERVRVSLIDLKGETVELVLAHLQLFDGAEVAPADVFHVAPFGGHIVPLNPLLPIVGVEPATQAALVVDLLEQLSDPWGPRMSNVARTLVRAAMAIRGSLRDVHALLLDATRVPAVAARVADPEVRFFLLESFPREPQASKESLRARLENILAIPALAEMLCAPSCVPADAFLESPLTLVNLGSGQVGVQKIATFIGSFIFVLVATAIFRRDRQKPLPHSYVAIDEWQVLARIVAADLADILARARASRVSLTLLNQGASQVRDASPALWDAVKTNVALEVLFRPDPSDLGHIEHLLPLDQAILDPARPDRTLSRGEVRDLVVRTLARLEPRRALFLRHLTREPATVLSTLTLPVERAKSAWQALTPPEREAWAAGRYGRPAASSSNSSTNATSAPAVAEEAGQLPLPFGPGDGTIVPSANPTEDVVPASAPGTTRIVPVRGGRLRRLPQ